MVRRGSSGVLAAASAENCFSALSPIPFVGATIVFLLVLSVFYLSLVLFPARWFPPMGQASGAWLPAPNDITI